MAHDFDFSTGKAGFWANGQKAWHGFGQITTGVNRSAEIILASGLNYDVAKLPLYTKLGAEEILVPGWYTTVRTDTNMPLGVVKDEYNIVQNRAAFEFFDEVIGKEDVQYETAGALKDGRLIFVTAKLKETMTVHGNGIKDEYQNYLVFTTGHDGQFSLRVFFTPTRIVCWNTFSASVRSAFAGDGVTATNSATAVSIKHRPNVKDKLEEAKKVLGIARSAFATQKTVFEHWLKKPVSDDRTKMLALQLLCDEEEYNRLATGEDMAAVLKARKMNSYRKLLDCIFDDPTQQNIQGTAYGFINGVTNYTTHMRDTNDGEKSVYNHLFGSSQDLQQRAVNLISVL